MVDSDMKSITIVKPGAFKDADCLFMIILGEEGLKRSEKAKLDKAPSDNRVNLTVAVTIRGLSHCHLVSQAERQMICRAMDTEVWR